MPRKHTIATLLAGCLMVTMPLDSSAAGLTEQPPSPTQPASPLSPDGGRGMPVPAGGEQPEGPGSKIRISPEVYRNLSPAQRAIVDERLREDLQRSSETRTIPSGEDGRTSRDRERSLRPSGEKPEGPERVSTPGMLLEAGLSDHEKRFETRRRPDAGGPLRQFGYDLFRNSPSTFAPVDDSPAPLDYPIGAGDELIVSALSPQRTMDVSLTVNRDGTVLVPNLGTIPVGGLNFAQASRLLERRIRGNAQHLQVTVRMGRLRNVTVYLVGQVKHPGAFTLGGLSTLSSALLASGGPSARGSLRHVQLKRRGKVVATLDLYGLLLKGDSSQDLRLQAGDVIFVPPIQALVALDGEVNQPGIFELSGPTDLGQALQMAGGLGPEADRRHIRIDRIDGHDVRETVDIDLARKPEGMKTLLQDGDLVTVVSIPENRDTSVSVDGHVHHPGKHAFRPGMVLSDLIRSADELKAEAYLEAGIIERTVAPDQHIELVPFSLSEVLNHRADASLKLSSRDHIRIYSRWDIQTRPKVRIAGAVNRGGEFDLLPHMRVSELIHLAGGMKPEADLNRAELTRVTIRDNRLVSTRVDLAPQRALEHDPAHDPELSRDDYLLIRAVPEYKLYRTITLMGEVRQPGTYTFQQGEGLADVLLRAGGLTQRAFANGAVFTRESVKTLERMRLEETTRQLESDIERLRAIATSGEKDSAASREMASKQALLAKISGTKPTGRVIVHLASAQKERGRELELEDGDTLTVPPIINSVSIIGQVYNPITVFHESNLSLDDYLAMTGGPTEKADRSLLYVIRADGTIISDRTRPSGVWPFRAAFGAMTMDPGDTIVVPEKVETENWVGNIKDVTQVLYQIATAAAVTWGILKQ
jgi:polysaccharide export outer membrane protein